MVKGTEGPPALPNSPIVKGAFGGRYADLLGQVPHDELVGLVQDNVIDVVEGLAGGF